MGNLEKKIINESDSELLGDILNNGFFDSMMKLGYSVNLSRDKNVAIIKNKLTELRFGYNPKEEVFYLSSYHEKGHIGNLDLMKLFKDEQYETEKEGSRIRIKSKYKDLRINQIKDGEKVKIIYSLSAIKSSVIKECLRLAEYYSEKEQ